MGIVSKTKELFKKKKSKKVKARAETRKVVKEEIGKYQLEKWQKGNDVISIRFADIINDNVSLSKEYYDCLERIIPNVSAAIWTWKRLCNTKLNFKLFGGTENQRNEAFLTLKNLNRKINPIKSVKNGGFNHLLNIYFGHFFKYGRFSGSLVLNEELNEIKTFLIYNPFRIRFTKTLRPVIFLEGGKSFFLNENTFYYIAQSMDIENPYGFSMLEAVPSLVKINRDLLRDMANSSSNAGTPRLHVKINQPDKEDSEDINDYFDRANKYFDDTVDELSTIGSDENFYTWKDTEIGVAGGATGSSGFVWRVNRQMVDEEMITAFRLFPWVLAKSTGTTKNWVQSQYDLLMTEVDSIQNDAKNFVEWIINTEFLLQGITNVKVQAKFDRPRDPAAKNNAVADRFLIDNVMTKVREGAIDPDDGARELGQERWFDKTKINFKDKKEKEKPKEKIDESEQPVDSGDNPEKSPDRKDK